MIKLLGEPILRKNAAIVENFEDRSFKGEAELLKDQLDLFRKENNFGRAISAPQIGISKRLIALNIDSRGTFCIVNPEITFRNEHYFSMWDDCMSFPWLMVKVKRHSTISIKYSTMEGKEVEWNNIEQSISELLQHEIDHLDGILSIDRAIDKDSIISREVFLKNFNYFQQQVDYTIEKT